MAYLFVHFREKTTEDGEQVYFSLSKDGYKWEMVGKGEPVLNATTGEGGVRDIVIVRTLKDEFVILATDLAMVRNGENKYKGNMRNAFWDGSKGLAMWKSKDLIHWSDEQILEFDDDELGCYWAPGIFYDEVSNQYVIHWSSATSNDNYSGLAIYYSLTEDFNKFTKPKLFFKKDNSEVLDSCIAKHDGQYHFFVKSSKNPKAVIHMTSSELFGTYIRDYNFDKEVEKLDKAYAYEAPMMYELLDGKIAFMMDFYGCKRKEDQGYVPFVIENLENIKLTINKDLFSFPYGFKHGVVMEISDDEYVRIKTNIK